MSTNLYEQLYSLLLYEIGFCCPIFDSGLTVIYDCVVELNFASLR